MTLSHWKVTMIVYVIKAYLLHDLHFVYVMEVFITLNSKANSMNT